VSPQTQVDFGDAPAIVYNIGDFIEKTVDFPRFSSGGPGPGGLEEERKLVDALKPILASTAAGIGKALEVLAPSQYTGEAILHAGDYSKVRRWIDRFATLSKTLSEPERAYINNPGYRINEAEDQLKELGNRLMESGPSVGQRPCTPSELLKVIAHLGRAIRPVARDFPEEYARGLAAHNQSKLNWLQDSAGALFSNSPHISDQRLQQQIVCRVAEASGESSYVDRANHCFKAAHEVSGLLEAYADELSGGDGARQGSFFELVPT
jgi:hypothetical protein